LDEHALVTGGSRGVGKQIARELAHRGYRVSVLAKQSEHLDRTVQEIAAAGGIATGFGADLTARGEPERMLSLAEAAFGPVQLLVNNAADFYESEISAVNMDLWDKAFELNIRVPALLCSSVLPSMRDARRGRIVNISSVVGIATYPGTGAYGITKHALRLLTEMIQSENGHLGINAIAICPGNIATPDGVSEPFETSLDINDVVNLLRFFLDQPDGVSLGPVVRLGRVQRRPLP
jgi:NAD(P)-dependent dehydrogenase (short-subunit alcohol dehydrogenase family)